MEKILMLTKYNIHSKLYTVNSYRVYMHEDYA